MELVNDCDVRVAITPQALSGTTDLTGETIDRKGYDHIMFVLITDALAASDLDAELLIQEGDASDLTDASAVADVDLILLESSTAIADTDDKVAKKIGYKGAKRYCRSNLTVTNNDGTDVVSGLAVLTGAHTKPVAQS